MEYLKVFRSSHLRCSIKKVVLKKLTNFSGKHLCWSLFLTKYITTQMFSCEIYQIFESPFFGELLQTIASWYSWSEIAL